MMKAQIRRDSATLTAIAALDHRAKCAIFLCPRDDLNTPIAVDTLAPASAVAREAFVGGLQIELRAEAAALLVLLAADVAAEMTMNRPRIKAGRDEMSLPYSPVELATEPQDGVQVFEAAYRMIKRYVWVGDVEPVFLALWVLHTYLLDVADHTPYVRISAPVKQCGKSTLPDVLAGLVAKGVRVSNMFPAFLLRVLDASAPTLLIDEVSAWLNGPNAGAQRRKSLRRIRWRPAN